MPRVPVDDHIAALATPPGTGALAIVRVSGPRAVELGAGVFRGRRDLNTLSGYEAQYGWIEDDGHPVDEVVALVFRSPHSFTGEDMVEFSCHGGGVPARRVLETLGKAGARPGEPGEFTRRAFLNRRIDLAQAEAVLDLITARGSRAQEHALTQLKGGLSHRVRDIAGQIRSVLVSIEAHLDFEDDVPEPPRVQELLEGLIRAQEALTHLSRTYAVSRPVREGLVITLAGRPNVGKSSLLNALLGFDRAIVHASPGTTRDVVDSMVEWNGIPVRLVDTAGLRGDPGPVEEAGMERSREELRKADLVLWVVDASEPPDPEDHEIAGTLEMDRVHLILNKRDLGQDHKWVNGYLPRARHRTSALTGDGIPDLQTKLEQELMSEIAGALEPEDIWVANERHAHELHQAALSLTRGQEILSQGRPWELGAADLHRSLDSLAAITGDRASEDLLNEIFGRFCIGK